MNGAISRLRNFTDYSTSPYHAAAYIAKTLDEKGFEKLSPEKPWKIKKGGAYYAVFSGTSVFAFSVGKNFNAGDKCRIAGSHIDWPCFRVKPRPEKVSAGCCKLSVEQYGGGIYSTWTDRPLGVSGILCLKDRNRKEKTVLYRSAPNLLTIPNIAIHLNREINKSNELNTDKHTLPLLRTVEEKWEKDGYFLSLLAKDTGCLPEDILSYDLCVYNPEKGCEIGTEGLYSSPRLDDYTSASACLYGISEAKRENGINISFFCDHEEIGSKTKNGAGGETFSMLTEKAAISLGLNRSEYLDLLLGGIFLSCDVGHAIHPNYTDLGDSTCPAYLGRGVVLKNNFDQKYSSDAEAIGKILSLCENHKIPHQLLMNRPDLPSGSTLGTIASAVLGMTAADVGVPLLAMHSSRELMGSDDQIALEKLILAFYREKTL